MGELIKLRYTKLKMGGRNPSVYVAVADGSDVHKVCEKFALTPPKNAYAMFWARRDMSEFAPNMGALPLVVIWVDPMLGMTRRVAGLAHEAAHAAKWYYDEVATDKKRRKDTREEQYCEWVGWIVDAAYGLLYGKREV